MVLEDILMYRDMRLCTYLYPTYTVYNVYIIIYICAYNIFIYFYSKNNTAEKYSAALLVGIYLPVKVYMHTYIYIIYSTDYI